MEALTFFICFCVGQEDVFIVLHNMIAGRPEVSGIHCVKDAKVPLLQFTFEGILIDLTFAKLQVTAVTEVRWSDNVTCSASSTYFPIIMAGYY